MASEVLAVQKMTEDLQSSGMPETQPNATVRAIAEGIKTFAVTREVLRDELTVTRDVFREELHRQLHSELKPIHTRLDSLEGKIEILNGRMFLLMISVLGVLGATLAAVLAALVPVLRTL